MTRFLLLLSTLGLALSGHGQSFGSLGGRIKQGNAPVEFAHIVLEGSNKGATTDENGNFLIENITPGTYLVKVSAVGFRAYSKSTSILSGKTTTLEIELSEDVSQLQEVVVTGTMREVSKMNSPIPIEVYTPRLFMKNPTPNIFEALSVVNGVQPQVNCNVCNTGDIHINGLEGPYTMILIDGMPIVSSLSTVYGLAGIPNSLVKRIEIVKGPPPLYMAPKLWVVSSILLPKNLPVCPRSKQICLRPALENTT
jgi:Outer membrane receptor for ferrienterochelin and colicins